MNLFNIWSKDNGIIHSDSITPDQWIAIRDAAGIDRLYGPKTDTLVSDELGHLYLIDDCGMARHVSPVDFVAVPTNQRDEVGKIGRPRKNNAPDDRTVGVPVHSLVGQTLKDTENQ